MARLTMESALRWFARACAVANPGTFLFAQARTVAAHLLEDRAEHCLRCCADCWTSRTPIKQQMIIEHLAEMLAHDAYPHLAQAVLETVQLGMACITRSVESAKTAEAAERSFETEDRPRWRFCLEQDLHLLDAMYSAAIEAALRAAEPS